MTNILSTLKDFVHTHQWEEFLVWAFGTSNLEEIAIEEAIALWNSTHPTEKIDPSIVIPVAEKLINLWNTKGST